ncbi:hypothetical protein SASPL_143423 [Salvia splendens]|uniref:Uncharacterized protein n=1 Tax=Salvia splendens TaxID=180675 RepID=A0A8X8Z9R2_SALSN|nr:hypothetical protein SASPL_143423 [Salvia splendens]
MTGHWIMFLLLLPTAYYNLKQYLSNKHLVDVTEVFKVVNTEKKARLIKLAFYVIFFGLVITRTIAMGTFSSVLSVLRSNDKEVDFRFQVLEIWKSVGLHCLLYALYLLTMMMLWLGRLYIELV